MRVFVDTNLLVAVVTTSIDTLLCHTTRNTRIVSRDVGSRSYCANPRSENTSFQSR